MNATPIPKKGRVFSGARPTGRQHLGNYLGAIKNYVALQDEYDCIYCIVDLHALTTVETTRDLRKNTYEMALDWLAAGIRPEETIVFVQSHVPEVTELHLLLSMVTPLGKLTDLPTFKEKIRQQPHNVNYGLVGYPVLMSADILLYKADAVPVGVDQRPHIEFAREVVRSFNHRYKTDVLVEPQMKATEFPKVLGIDGKRKMSKSLNNHIELALTPEETRQRVMQMVYRTGPHPGGDQAARHADGDRPPTHPPLRSRQPGCLQRILPAQGLLRRGGDRDGQHRVPPGGDWLRAMQDTPGQEYERLFRPLPRAPRPTG